MPIRWKWALVRRSTSFCFAFPPHGMVFPRPSDVCMFVLSVCLSLHRVLVSRSPPSLLRFQDPQTWWVTPWSPPPPLRTSEGWVEKGRDSGQGGSFLSSV